MAQLRLGDGRSLEYLVEGPEVGPVLVFHHGTPSAAVPVPAVARAAEARGARILWYSRPGYGRSDPAPERSVADAAADVAALLDELGVDDFVTAGWSGGGPHALATAAGLSGRCRAVATIAGVAPFEAPGLDWYAGMGEENLSEFGLATQGFAALDAGLRAFGLELRDATVAGLTAGMAGLLPPVDLRAVEAGMGEYLVASFRRAMADGVAGWRDDDLAFVRPWGADPTALGVPLTVWQGDRDLMVPAAHGAWLAAHVPGAAHRPAPGHGHLSIVADLAGEIIDGLLAA